MKLTGDLRRITAQRDNKNHDIVLLIDKVEYLTNKKDGRYFQAFSFEDELEPPLEITGDRLARINAKNAPEGEYEFAVFEVENGEYSRNENITLEITLSYDFEEDLCILTSGYYAITLPPNAYEQLKQEREKEMAFKNRRNRKR